MKAKVLPVLLLALIGFRCEAFDIVFKGTVRDSQGEQPIIGATVTLQSLTDRSVWLSTCADYAGRFSIKLPEFGEYRLKASFAGFESFERICYIDKEASLIVNVWLREDSHTIVPEQRKSILVERKNQRRPLRDPAIDAAREVTKKMKSKLQLSPSQEVVIGLFNERYFTKMELLKAQAESDQGVLVKIEQLKRERNARLEEMLSEDQYEKWMRYLEPTDRKPAKKPHR